MAISTTCRNVPAGSVGRMDTSDQLRGGALILTWDQTYTGDLENCVVIYLDYGVWGAGEAHLGFGGVGVR